MSTFRFSNLLATILLSLSTQLAAQTAFFKTAPRDAMPLPSEIFGVDKEFAVAVDVRALAANRRARESYLVKGSDGRDLLFKQARIDLQSGFIPTEDLEDVIPDPRLDNRELSYAWMGMSGNQTLTFTVYKGLISGTLIGDRGYNYQLAPTKNGLRWQSFDLRKFPTIEPAGLDRPASALNSVDTLPALQANRFVDVVKVVVLHTPQALAAAGGSQALNVQISQAINEMNMSFRNSGVSTIQIENVSYLANSNGSDESVEVPLSVFDEDAPPTLPGCTLGTQPCRWISYRKFLRDDLYVFSRKALAQASLVIMVVNYVSAGPTPILGVAYNQRPDCAGAAAPGDSLPNACQVGIGYYSFAAAAVSLGQMNALRVFNHEMGHQFGMEHPTSNDVPSFPWSFGHFVPNVGETIMSTQGYSFPSCQCPMRPQFSNPYLNFLGTSIPSGTSLRYNALTAQRLAPAMSDYYNSLLTDVILRTGFDELLDP